MFQNSNFRNVQEFKLSECSRIQTFGMFKNSNFRNVQEFKLSKCSRIQTFEMFQNSNFRNVPEFKLSKCSRIQTFEMFKNSNFRNVPKIKLLLQCLPYNACYNRMFGTLETDNKYKCCNIKFKLLSSTDKNSRDELMCAY